MKIASKVFLALVLVAAIGGCKKKGTLTPEDHGTQCSSILGKLEQMSKKDIVDKCCGMDTKSGIWVECAGGAVSVFDYVAERPVE